MTEVSLDSGDLLRVAVAAEPLTAVNSIDINSREWLKWLLRLTETFADRVLDPFRPTLTGSIAEAVFEAC